MVESPDGLYSIEQLINTPACPKWYEPNYSSPEWRGGKARKTIIDGEYNNTGYYIFTVSGPVVTVDYYADVDGGYYSGGRSPNQQFPHVGDTSLITPDFTFTKKATWQYSLNGAAFMVAQGESYNTVTDTYGGTSIRLAGINTSTSVECADCADATANTMPLTKRVTTAWKDQTSEVDSSVLMLYGLCENGQSTTAPYLLRMANGGTANAGTRIVTKDSSGNWVDAATLTQNGQKFVQGPANTAYAAGSYGYMPGTGEAWVMLDYEGTFAIKQFD